MKIEKIMPITEQFNSIYLKHYKKAFRFTRWYVRDDLVAEDIATEALIKLWETMKKDPVEKPVSLLLTILKRKSLDYLKTQMHAREAFAALADWQQRELTIRISTLEACNPDSVLSDEIQKIVTDTLNGLPVQTRRVFIMSRLEEKSGKEIAEALGITVKGVDYHIAKSLKALRVSLKDYLPLLSFFF